LVTELVDVLASAEVGPPTLTAIPIALTWRSPWSGRFFFFNFVSGLPSSPIRGVEVNEKNVFPTLSDEPDAGEFDQGNLDLRRAFRLGASAEGLSPSEVSVSVLSVDVVAVGSRYSMISSNSSR
jgi:hypothetical protein